MIYTLFMSGLRYSLEVRRYGYLTKPDPRPLKCASQLLGHKCIESTEVYTNVLTFDVTHFLDGVDFH